ncbi:unnamed protein product [Pieris brassicae]|uniref:FXNA-like protease n=1 Tax=Pieris brassicae TaxID=7116 RepID=A0A9P0TPG9_PIEBR|nr:unnamed protein product [Pieris brassicae]
MVLTSKSIYIAQYLERNIKTYKMDAEVVKENVWQAGSVRTRWVVLAALCSCVAVLVAAVCDQTLPTPLDRSAPKDRFIAEIAYEHLVNLTSIGPRVAGSYENEVAAVKVLVNAARGIQSAASAHNRVEFDVFRASGAFSLTFIDGMSNIYRDVQSVVIRVRGAGGESRPTRRSALLLNCHYDTVPDSPGASDDGAGCAVVLETLRALAASPHPLRHDVVALLNGAEENIMQASHAFVTTHRWAKSLRAFINIEACGAGGREVLFQAGPNDPWMLEVYAGAVPHPFASSLAQELFESGLIPADTDFRIFRDFANISGVDLAWNSNGYVYHTSLDTADKVPRATLQRTGDNVLALAHGLLSNERLEAAAERTRAPVYFDVVGRVVILARAPAAFVATILALATVVLKLYLSATQAKQLYIPRMRWMRVVGRALLSVTLAQCCGLAASIAVALLLHVSGARLAFYSRPWLLIPLYSVPAVVASWWDARLTWGKAQRGGGVATIARGEWTLRAWHDALCLTAAILLAAGASFGLRSAFVVFLWTLPASADVICVLLGVHGAPRVVCGAFAAALPALQTAYLALASLNMFVPVMGRAGTSALPPDVIMAVLVGALTLTLFSWMLPLVVAAKQPQKLIRLGWAVTLSTVVLVLCTPLGFPYSEARPQRFMVFHTRRTEHSHTPRDTLLYWVPALDANTPQSVYAHVPEVAYAPATCYDKLYCGAPYYLPVISLVAHGHELPALEEPKTSLNASAEVIGEGPTRDLKLKLHGPNHIVVILSPVTGSISWCQTGEFKIIPQPGPQWQNRQTYFVSLHDALSPAPWELLCRIESHGNGSKWVDISVAGHSMSGALKHSDAHAQLLSRFPNWSAVTGWGVHLHLFSL